MLNRRTKPLVARDCDKYPQGDESEALLGRTDEFINLPHNYHQSTNNHYQQVPASVQVGNQQNVIGYNLAQPLEFSQTQVPLPIQRRARDRSPTSQNNLLISNNNTSNHTNSNLTFAPVPLSQQLQQHNYGGENYELGPYNANYSRAISIYNSNDSNNSRHPTTDFIYYVVQPGDTLQNLSVKYSCPVASIKRLNNLWSDQEFFGLTRLKLPVGKLRLIADAIDADVTAKRNIPLINNDSRQASSQQQTEPREPILDIGQSTNTESHLPHTQSTFLHQDVNDDEFNLNPDDIVEHRLRGNDSIFKDYDSNIEKARTAARSYNDNANSIMQTLAQSGNIVDEDLDDNDPNKMAQREAKILLNDLSDYGLSYNGLILFIFIVCLIFPLAYVIYLEETHHDSNKTA